MQTLVTDYETDRLRLTAEMTPRQQTTLLRTIATFLEVAALKTARRA